MRIARVFPQRTDLSPTDELAFFDVPGLYPPEVDEVHVSCCFTYDKQRAEMLAEEWKKVAPVKIGGPAYGDPGGDFVPGRYVAPGYVITSRGCNNRCWFCRVWKDEGPTRTLRIQNGFNVMDSSLFQCPEDHINGVIDMLAQQPRPAVFSGGIEAKRITDRHIGRLWSLRPQYMYFAYDTPDDLEPLVEVGKKLRYADFTRYHMRCYVLIGYPGDTFQKAEERLLDAWGAGFMPFAMLYVNNDGLWDKSWAKFRRTWCRPPAIKCETLKLFLAGKRSRFYAE